MIYNFSAGPTDLPQEVMLEIKDEFLNFANAKTSVIAISHRSKDFMEIYYSMQNDLRDLMGIPDNYKILFCQGGASAQFSMIPFNIGGSTANYSLTGHWSQKAITEAKRYLDINITNDSTENNFTNIADFTSWQIEKSASYLHYCPNETIAGLEFSYIPDSFDMPLVADMSSNILSKQVDVAKFGVIYAGAQKNIGASGLTVVIVREDLIGRAPKHTPKLFNWKTYLDNDSMFNTPATFSWYSAYKVFRWLKKQGIKNIYQINEQKAKLLYSFIDKSDFYSNNVNKEYRSQMNVPFILKDENLNEIFLQQSFDSGLLALKGHKSVGGMRASIYNAMPLEGVKTLVTFMQDFEKKYG